MENVKTAKQSKPIKKIPKIRFQDGPKTLGQGTKVKRQVRKNREEEKKEKKYDKKDEKEEQGEKKPNRFMDEWLGIKREPVDERYKPGKPKPNRLVASPSVGIRILYQFSFYCLSLAITSPVSKSMLRMLR